MTGPTSLADAISHSSPCEVILTPLLPESISKSDEGNDPPVSAHDCVCCSPGNGAHCCEEGLQLDEICAEVSSASPATSDNSLNAI